VEEAQTGPSICVYTFRTGDETTRQVAWAAGDPEGAAAELSREIAEEGEADGVITADALTGAEPVNGSTRFASDFLPAVNPARAHHVAPDCYLFETEDDPPGDYDARHTFTLIEEEGVWYFVAGRRFVNRIGYVYTRVAWEDENTAYAYRGEEG
jgi:hypothetical protein